jgi:2-oxoisovalerate dehydrogenase E1 component
VLFFEHKQLYRSVYQDVPVDYYTLPIGKAALIKEGNEVTIIAFGAAVHWAWIPYQIILKFQQIY